MGRHTKKSVRTKSIQEMVELAYNFTFDLSKLSQTLFKDIAKFSEKEKVPKKMGDLARTLIEKFDVNKIIGLPVDDSITIIEDIIEIHLKNSLYREHFLKTNKRALFLPHCCRKYMDSRCKADFNPEFASYLCRNCSDDCQVNKATKLAKKRKLRCVRIARQLLYQKDFSEEYV
ncbi:MAG: DUF116 domain-containing protein [Candidatus Thermoplasmatota archaeon]|nr:DUF116 domain-containing protein [Candidatus Thermoplasmatota archaeon]